MKKCVKCKEFKALEDFSLAGSLKNGLPRYKSRCKICIRDYDNQRYKDRPEEKTRRQRTHDNYCQTVKVKYYEFLHNNPCVDCGESDILFLECDHIIDGKIAGIGTLMSKHASWEKILDEIAKCVVRCVKCHREITATRGGWNILRYR